VAPSTAALGSCSRAADLDAINCQLPSFLYCIVRLLRILRFFALIFRSKIDEHCNVLSQMIVFASSGNVKEMIACLEQGANIDARDAVRALFLFERQLGITCYVFIS
jgi:hypothetical protein